MTVGAEKLFWTVANVTVLVAVQHLLQCIINATFLAVNRCPSDRLRGQFDAVEGVGWPC
jgi:hypothetical protein